MTDRDKLIELLKGAETKVAEALTRPLELEEWLGIYADYLLANGVRLSAELQNKCGSCAYAKPIVAFGKSKCYVQCTNREHIERFCTREISTLRQRTNPACKNYKECEGK